jgi:hypothetical protein
VEKLGIAYIDPGMRLEAAVKRIEKSKEFNDLVENCISAFHVAGTKASKPHVGKYVPVERIQIPHFLRRSGFYLELFENKSIDADRYFKQLWSAFNDQRVKTITLRLVQGVVFPSRIIDFKAFAIQKFTKRELDELFNNKINRIFYRSAEIDTNLLSYFWFIKEENYYRIKRRGNNEPNTSDKKADSVRPDPLDDFSLVPRTFPDNVLQLLTLYQWMPVWEVGELGWRGFKIPLTTRITDDILSSPYDAPWLPELEFYPPDFGKTSPVYHSELEKNDVDRLKDSVSKVQEFLDQIDLEAVGWEFIKLAMGYFAKAFFTEGLEQLLWHIVVLEILFGEKTEATESIRRRIGNMFGDNEKKRVRKTITELYEFRSDLVHGRRFEKKVQEAHLAQARELARKSLMWFLTCYLPAIQRSLGQRGMTLGDYPGRDELLTVLDFDQKALARRRYVFAVLSEISI